jgi:hypothetical protein
MFLVFSFYLLYLYLISEIFNHYHAFIYNVSSIFFILFIYIYNLSVNATNEVTRKSIATVIDRVITNVTDGVFCRNVISSGRDNEVSFLMQPNALAAVGALCDKPTVKRTNLYEAQPTSMPSSMPSSSPTHSPTPVKSPSVFPLKYLAFLSLIFLFGCCCCCCFMRMYPAALKKKSGHKYDILLLIDNDEVMIENIDHTDIAFYRRTWIEEDHHTLDWKINANTDVLEVRFEVRFFDHYDLLAKGGVMETDDWKGNDDGKVEYYVNRAIMHKGMIIRAKPKDIRDSKYAQFTRQRRGTLDIDDVNDNTQDDDSHLASSPPQRNLQRMPLQFLNGGSLLSTRLQDSGSEEESENEMEESNSTIRQQETIDVSDFFPKIPRDIQMRRSLGNNVHWDTYEADGSIDVADDESSMTMSVCPVRRDAYLSYEESLSIPMRPGSMNSQSSEVYIYIYVYICIYIYMYINIYIYIYICI